MSNEIQKDEYYLPGDLGKVRFGANEGDITKVFKGKDGATTVTINPQVEKIIVLNNGECMDLDEWTNIPAEGTSKTEDAEFEVIEQKQIEDKK